MSHEWAKNPLPPPEITPKQRILDGDLSTTTIRDFIAYSAKLSEIDPYIAVEIARAESGFVWNAKNPASSASGVFQFINGTFLRFCSDDLSLKNDPIIQVECAISILKEKGGENHWNESRKWWGNVLKYN